MESSMEVEQELDFSQLYTQPKTPVVVRWMRKFNDDTLSHVDFREYWRTYVPNAFFPEQNTSSLDWIIKGETDASQEMLFNTLEEFICNGEKTAIFNYITTADNPPSVCGKVFKMGEPKYNCRDCGMDATCVLCADCFKQSEHRTHRYKMGTLGGGGCCDCGDVEAWKTEPYCKTHLLGLRKSQNVDHFRFPPDLVKRTEIVFSCVLRYAYQVLTLEYSPGLPGDLRPRDDPDNPLSVFEADQYCTVLYNDETHTFEQVINTLARVIKCSQRDAIEFVTNIDREGRTVVKSSTFQHCSELKADIERFTSRHGTRPLKVLVVHSHVIAHQMFALGLLTWLQKMTSLAEGFRVIFSSVILGNNNSSDGQAIIDGILQRDSTLWKSARLHWHRLFISGMFMEYETKKSFAKHFTKHYGNIMKDFIRDDHDHSFSVASLSLQVFSVPTLAHYLIAHEDVLLVLLNTFISECLRKCNKLGRLEFDRTAPSGPFKRAFYILFDLRYLLGAPPDVWTDELRRGFILGVSLILTLLSYMQEMDSVTRQTGQHMEYEPEWESAFNLHLKLAPVITLLLKWCGTDRVVLIKAYRLTLKTLLDNTPVENVFGEVKELADHSTNCLQYDVASQPVSIHLPLSRFLAGLHLHLQKFGLSFDSSEFFNFTKQSVIIPTPVKIIEPVLRTQVMIAQVHAGMWRRNGYSLSNQIYFYQNVKCRGEMLDRDVVLLQVGASLIESNEFLLHVLNKYNLIGWAKNDFESSSTKEEDCMKQVINMVEEFLSLLIIIIGERYVPGVGQVSADDCIKNEIIHQLLIKPLSHSEVNKALPDDVNLETGMERVINEVATFKKPSQTSGRGVYEVKKDCLEKYNVFFYHYTKEDLSKSEEEQRKLRKTVHGFECCPPPVLPPFSEPFSMVSNLLQCDVMLHIMSLVLQRSANLRARSFSEAQLHKVLHLIGYALHEEEQKYNSFFIFTKKAEKWGIEALLEELSSSPRIEAHRDLIKWTLSKYRQVASPTHSLNMEVVGDKSSGSQQSTDSNPKYFRAKLAAERRAALMAQMAALQQSFIKDNADLFEQTVTAIDVPGEPDLEEAEAQEQSPVAVGPSQTAKVSEERTFTCILCQEHQIISPEGPAMVLAAFVQKSTVLCRNRSQNEPDAIESMFLTSSMGPAPHTSTCGHVMHSICWKKYIETIQTKENRRPYRLRTPTSYDIEKNEYLCPLCECLNNTVLPIVPHLQTLVNSTTKEPINKLSFANWFEASRIAISHKLRTDKARLEKSIARSNTMCGDGPSAATTSTDETESMSSTVSTSSPPRAGSSSQVTNSEMSSEGSDPLAVEASPGHCVHESMRQDPAAEGASQEDEDEGINVHVPLSLVDVCMQLRVYQDSSAGSSSQQSENRQDNCLSDDLLDMIFLFSQVAFTKAFYIGPREDDPGVPMMAWKSCAYTIHSIEWLLRYTNKPLLGDFTCRQQDGLENLIRLAGVIGSSWAEGQVINRHGVKLLTMVIDNDKSDPSVIDWDCFGLLVPMTAALPSMFYSDPVPVPTGSALELHSLHLMFLSHVAQIIICCDLSSCCDSDAPEDVSCEATSCLTGVARCFKDLVKINTDKLWKLIADNSLSFLRCCAIFYHFLTGVPASQPLKVPGGDTYENLCSYLGLPTTCAGLLDQSYVITLFNIWASHPKIKSLRNSKENIRDLTPLNELVTLPEDYSELINTVSLFTCPNSDQEDSRNPTMCLICGEMLCSQTYCCQTELNKLLVGACTYHAQVCGAGAGIFLRVRECEILLLASPFKGCFKAPPYVDDYGEADQGLRRGNPLHLCKDSYRKLQLLWLSHTIYEEIARAIENAHSLMPTQWQHL